MTEYDLSQYDYLDLGCSEGRSIAFGRQKFLGRRGLGLDLDARVVGIARQAGHDAIVADALAFDPAPHRFDFVTTDHLLEHLPSKAAVSTMIGRLPALARHFAYIATPSFEGEASLRQAGLRQAWMHWTGHPTHVSLADYLEILPALGFEQFEIECVGLVYHSSHSSVVPYSAPADQITYDAAKNGPKPSLYLREKAFVELQLLVQMPGGDASVWHLAKQCFRRSVYEHSLPSCLHTLEDQALRRTGVVAYALPTTGDAARHLHHPTSIVSSITSDGSLLLDTSGNDSQFQLYDSPLPSGLRPPVWLSLEMRNAVPRAQGAVYWDCGQGFTQAQSASWPLPGDMVWRAHAVALGAVTPVTNVRFDPSDREDHVEIRRLVVCTEG
jgi:hypothetical protein